MVDRMITVITRLCLALVGLAIAIAITNAALSEVSKHVDTLVLVVVLVLAGRLVWLHSREY